MSKSAFVCLLGAAIVAMGAFGNREIILTGGMIIVILGFLSED